MRRKWTKNEIRLLRKLYPHRQTVDVAIALNRPVGPVYQAAAKQGLRKSAKYLASPDAHRFDGLKGMGSRFTKGQKAWNEGLRGYMGANRTSFKKGIKVWNHKPVGSERVNVDGYIEIKTAEPRTWRSKHVVVWEKRHGKVKRGWCVVFKNRNKLNCDLKNMELISREENMRRNTYHRYPKEIARLIQLRGALQRQINKRSQREK